MNQPTEGEISKRCSLGVSDRLSIVNALMAQDRIEIREKQEAVFRLTYYVVPGLVGLAVFFVGHQELRNVLLLAQILLLLLYVVSFLTFRSWLVQTRACLQIRESFYLNQNLLYSEPFEPIRKIEEQDRVTHFEDNALWFPFGVTVACAIVLLTYMVLHQT